jgi:tyrosine-protein kinase Etk/Wzc
MVSNNENVTMHDLAVRDKEDFHLLDILTALAKRKWFLVLFPTALAVCAGVIAMLMTPVFSATSVMMPPQQQSSGIASMLGQLGGLAGAASSVGGLKNPSDLYVGMLQSRTVADALVERFKLKERYEMSLPGARDQLKKNSTISAGKDGLISINVEDRDPVVAAAMANAYVEELDALTKKLAVGEAATRRVFFEKQLRSTKDQLADAEVAMKDTQQRTGMLQLEGQVKGAIASAAQLQGEIAAKEVQLTAMRSFATNNNPELLRLQQELRGLNIQLDKLENGGVAKSGDLRISSGKLPEVGVEYIRSMRDVKYYEAIYELLAKQYELARIDEAKESSLIQLLDRAVPAEKKSKPKVLLVAILTFMAGMAVAILVALLRDVYLRSQQAPHTAHRWVALNHALRGKRAS